MPAPANCVWLKMLYISARNMSARFSLFSGNDLENVMSQLSRRVLGRLMMLPAPAFPKHSMDCPTPNCGVAPGVQLHGKGIVNTLSLRIWLPGDPLTLLPTPGVASGVTPANDT